MEVEDTIKEYTQKVEQASTDFEITNTEIKRRYLIWNIDAFNTIASNVTVNRGTFGTGYPFYALDENLEGTLPIIQEQIRYNRQLVIDGEPVQKSIWLCKSCLERNYSSMPDLKKVCGPCPNVIGTLKPRKFINRLPDLDLWLVCEDGCVEQAQEQLTALLDKYHMHTSDVDPISSIEDVVKISKMIKSGKLPNIFLPIDTHIIEYSKIKELIQQVPEVLIHARQMEIKPYLPIHPKSYRKKWQYDDEAYNFIYDYLAAFTSFNFSEDLQQALDSSRAAVVAEHTPEELFKFLMQSATEANFRRFQSMELEEYFLKKMKNWRELSQQSKSRIVTPKTRLSPITFPNTDEDIPI